MSPYGLSLVAAPEAPPELQAARTRAAVAAAASSAAGRRRVRRFTAGSNRVGSADVERDAILVDLLSC